MKLIGFSRVYVKVFAPGNKKFTQVVYWAPQDELYTQHFVDAVREKVFQEIAEHFPAQEYSCVLLAANKLNFVHRCAHA